MSLTKWLYTFIPPQNVLVVESVAYITCPVCGREFTIIDEDYVECLYDYVFASESCADLPAITCPYCSATLLFY